MGSVHYLPPEQAAGKTATTKSDIYSMGIIFYELLSGSLPFRGDNAVEIALKHMREPLPSLREENPAIPQSIENIIRKATAKNPKNRYDSARSMHEDLLTALNDDRMDEAVYQYKYPENEYEGKKIKKEKDEAEPEVKIENVEEAELSKEKEEPMANLDEESSEKKNKIVIIILACIFILIAIALVVLFFVLPKVSNGESVTVPNCTNLKVTACQNKLAELGLEVDEDIEAVPSDDIDKNRVVKTEPEKGRSVKKGTKVTIYKSSGENTVALENYVGENAIRIKTLLETKYELVVTIAKKDPEDDTKDYDEDEIIGQSLAAGSAVKKGDQLILYTPNIVDKLPNMAEEGWTLSDAKAFCEKYGIKLESVAEYTNAYADGTIISQNRKAGDPIIKGTTIKVTVATDPSKKPVEKPVEEETGGEETGSETGDNTNQNANETNNGE